MINQSEAKQDYFQLLIHLNKSNTVKNKKTQLYFEIDGNYLFAALSDRQRVLLCEKRENKWRELADSQFLDLAIFIAERLQRKFYNVNSDLTKQILASLFQLPD